MRKIFYASLAVTLLISTAISCKKKTTTPFTYTVSGLTDLSVYVGDSVTLPLQVSTLTGDAENVTLSVAGLPANVRGTITPASGKPNFNAQLKISADAGSTDGTNVITVNAFSSSTGTKPYNINLTVSECSGDVIGLYNGTDVSGNSSYQYQNMTVLAGSQPNHIKIQGWFDDIQLHCSSHTLTATPQAGNGYTLTGSGTFTSNTITINYILANTNDTTRLSGTLTMTKQ